MNFRKKTWQNRLKVYKNYNNWLLTGSILLTLVGFSSVTVHADNNQVNENKQTTVVENNDSNNTNIVSSTDKLDDTKQTTKNDATTNFDYDNQVNDKSTYFNDDKINESVDQVDSNQESTQNQEKVSDESTENENKTQLQKNVLSTIQTQQNGWSADYNQYYINGEAITGVHEIDGTYYDFDSNHNLVRNNYVQSQWGDWYMFGSDGKIVSGVTPWAGTYYYFDPYTYLRVDNNYVQSQWGDWYMFGGDGKIVSGVTPWAGTYYCFDPYTYLRVDNNYVQSQWGDWYMFGSDGKIVSGVTPWAGTYYCFDPYTYLRVDNNYVQSQWGTWYMFGDGGRIVSGLADWYGYKYYFDENTYVKVTNDWRDTSYGHAHFNSDGILDYFADDQKADEVVSIASQFNGWGYAWGGNNPRTGFDCSGLTQYAFSQIGISLPRTSEDQYYNSTHISAGQAKKGDLVFFSEGGSIIHVGIYLGNDLMIDAQIGGAGIGVHRVSQLSAYYPVSYGRYLNI